MLPNLQFFNSLWKLHFLEIWDMIFTVLWIWRGRSYWEILTGKSWSVGQSNQRHIWWHIWRYNLTRHAIQLDTSESKTMTWNVWFGIKSVLSATTPEVWSQKAKSNCYSVHCLPFSLLWQVYPNQIIIVILPSRILGVRVFINKEVRLFPNIDPAGRYLL